MSLTFNPDVPTVFQPNPYGCAVATTAFCLDSVGIDVSYAEMDDIMVPGLVTHALGLLNGSGAGIVGLLTDRYGLQAHNQHGISFDEVAEMAGSQPIGIGGHEWGGPNLGHWVAVRGRTDDGRLVLANPDTSTTYGQQSLSEAGFDARGPFSAFFIDDIGNANIGTATPRFLVVDTDGEGVRLRDTPRLSGARVGAVSEGRVVRAVEADGFSWRDVVDASAVEGWAANEFLSLELGAYRVLGAQNPGLRSSPSSGAAIIRDLQPNELLQGMVPNEEAYIRVRAADGAVGWVRAQYLRRL
jgi:SH3-like domain-containing protein